TSTRWLRAESLALLIAALVGYALADASWLLFALLLLAPDLGMLGYLANPRVGALTYNAVHVYAWPALLLALWAAGVAEWALAPGLIWLAHIAMDRALGYGLKQPDSFKHTHLGWIGGDRRSNE
ncbi:MAG TPA: DUF4260 domain-containing protein, partial [Longimicrobiales bacterium]|nr:DUF4260 domain-containing protein [Longimicrobiales bacterium]